VRHLPRARARPRLRRQRHHFLASQHTLRNYETAFYDAPLADNNSYEQWVQEGAHDITRRATRRWQSMLADYEMPAIDAARDDAVRDFIQRRKAETPDASY
jgi:trimethylamine--corrinoid protein Co-methyltransferase